MTSNGHFSSVGDVDGGDYQHGVQVVDGDKEFKYVTFVKQEHCLHVFRTGRSVRQLERTMIYTPFSII